jgi:hypothetical protein
LINRPKLNTYIRVCEYYVVTKPDLRKYVKHPQGYVGWALDSRRALGVTGPLGPGLVEILWQVGPPLAAGDDRVPRVGGVRIGVKLGACQGDQIRN